MLNILIVDDEPAIRQVLAARIRGVGHLVEEAGDGETAMSMLGRGDVDVCICDIQLPDFSGMEILRRAKEQGVDTNFLMMTAFASVNTAIEAMKIGAHDFLIKPVRHDDVLHRLEQIASVAGLKEENRRLRELVDEKAPGEFCSRSAVMQEIEKLAGKVARTDGTLLITGESGTGKSFISRRIHEQSKRADRPFVSVNCGAIPEHLLESEFFGHIKGAFTGADRARKGLFREADGGTLFLDEVFELPLSLQVKLLHALEEKEIRPVGSEQAFKINVRIISATNRDVKKMVAEGEFREDLYYRLNVLHMHLPPLRERREDLPELIRFFIQEEARRLGVEQEYSLDPAAEDLLVSYEWFGNLRQLQNVIARTLVMADGSEIGVSDLPADVTPSGDQSSVVNAGDSGGLTLREQVRNFEVQVINRAIQEAGGDRPTAARRLGIGLSTLYRKLEETEA